MDKQLKDRDEFLAEIHDRLQLAQDVMKVAHDQSRWELEFAVGEWAWLRLHHCLASGITPSNPSKLDPRFYGPFQVVARVGAVAYRLRLPNNVKIHDVFHVGLLKKFVGTPPVAPPSLPPIHNGAIVAVPAKAVKARLYRGVHQILVQWEDLPRSSASWEDLPAFQECYPSFQLEDKLLLEEGSDVMWGKTLC